LTLAGRFAVAALAIASQAWPQQRPDFSGTWILQNTAESPADVPVTLIVDQDASAISIIRTIA
jgi:hypothetical protein